MKTAEERSNYHIWYALDKIMRKALPNSPGEVSYAFNIDITRTDPISYMDERNALDYLLNNGVIEKIGEDVIAEGGEKGTSSYYVEEIYRLKIKNKFYDFYDRFYLKAFGLENKKDKRVWNRTIQNLIQSLSGKYEKKLISLLSAADKTSKELREQIGDVDIYHLISNTNKKIKKRGFKIEKTDKKDLDDRKKYRLSISEKR